MLTDAPSFEGMAALRELPWPAKIYFVLCIGAAGILLVRSGRAYESLDWSSTLVLALLFLVCESVPTQLSVRQAAISVSFSAALAAVVLVGPEGAALVAATAVFSCTTWARHPKRLFNGAQFLISGYTAGWVYTLAGESRACSSAPTSRRSSCPTAPRPSCSWRSTSC